MTAVASPRGSMAMIACISPSVNSRPMRRKPTISTRRPMNSSSAMPRMKSPMVQVSSSKSRRNNFV